MGAGPRVLELDPVIACERRLFDGLHEIVNRGPEEALVETGGYAFGPAVHGLHEKKPVRLQHARHFAQQTPEVERMIQGIREHGVDAAIGELQRVKIT